MHLSKKDIIVRVLTLYCCKKHPSLQDHAGNMCWLLPPPPRGSQPASCKHTLSLPWSASLSLSGITYKLTLKLITAKNNY